MKTKLKLTQETLLNLNSSERKQFATTACHSVVNGNPACDTVTSYPPRQP
jgi:hypothetical protein